MKKFDSIRPYFDSEVSQVLIELSDNRRFLKMLLSSGGFNRLRFLPFSRKILNIFLKNRIKKIKNVADYQNEFESIVSKVVKNSINKFTVSGIENLDKDKGYLFISNHRDITLDSALLNLALHQNEFESIVSKVVKNSINKFTVSGIENLDKDKGYLFISNHRDITLDSALLNLALHQNKFKTTYNAVGNNLLSEKWASDLMRLNKSFIIDRSDKSKRDIYKSLNLASEFISNAIKNKNESIWIAQKQGRSKDGNDFTDPSVIKMIHLNGRKKISIDEYLNNLNVIPVAISYEKDPNDILKAQELFHTDLGQSYEKDRKEDLKSIFEGIVGQKGDVNLIIGKKIIFNEDSYEYCSNQITNAIKDSYKLQSTNYAAAIMQGKLNKNNFESPKINESIEYLNGRLKQIPKEMEPYLLNQYSNPTIAK